MLYFPLAMENDKVDEQNLKGGHAPAVKIGGVRMVSKPSPLKEDKPTPTKATEEDLEEFGEDEKPSKAPSALVSGAVIDDADAFPKEAVKAFHEKPAPKHENRAVAAKPHIIQQPRK